jgi:hypothetical protein
MPQPERFRASAVQRDVRVAPRLPVYISPAWDQAMRRLGLTEERITGQAMKLRHKIRLFWDGGPQDSRQRSKIKGEVFFILLELAQEAGVIWDDCDRRKWLCERLTLRSLGLFPSLPEGVQADRNGELAPEVLRNGVRARVRFTRQIFGLTEADVEHLLRLSPGYVSELEDGTNRITIDFLIRLATEFPGLNIRWLLGAPG